MPRANHVDWVKRNSSQLLEWRRLHPWSPLQLDGADFRGQDLSNRDLRAANLRGARFDDATLAGANLSEAQLEDAQFVNARLMNANFVRAAMSGANLSGARAPYASFADARLERARLRRATLTTSLFMRTRLQHADFSDAVLREADFSGAVVENADLSSADLTGSRLIGCQVHETRFEKANMVGADLSGMIASRHTSFAHANLTRANLRGTILLECSLDNARLEGARLEGAVISSTSLRDTDFSAVSMSAVTFSNADLSQSILDSVTHRGPSSVGIDTALVTFARLSRAGSARFADFLRGTGIPPFAVDYVRETALGLSPIQLQSVFVSYAAIDAEFASKLSTDLRRRGAQVFLFHDDAPGGQRIQTVVAEQIRWMDRLLVVCSRASLARAGVRNEVDEGIQKESRDGRDVLFPLIVDDVLHAAARPSGVDDGTRELEPVVIAYADLLRGRTWRDFRTWHDQTKYEAEFAILLQDLADAAGRGSRRGDSLA